MMYGGMFTAQAVTVVMKPWLGPLSWVGQTPAELITMITGTSTMPTEMENHCTVDDLCFAMRERV